MAIASGNLGVTRAGLYVLITNQADFSQYVSNIPCDSAGNYTVIGDRGFEMPAGTYNISTGPSSRGPWSVTGSTVVATEIIPGPLVAQSLSVGPNTPDPLIALGGWHIGNGYLISPPPNGTDDTTSLNNILAAVPASGGEVLLQPGLYKAPTGGLTCANPVSIEGRGTGVG